MFSIKHGVIAIILVSSQAFALPQNQLKIGVSGDSYVNSNQNFYRDDASKITNDLYLQFNAEGEKKRLLYKATGSVRYGQTEQGAYFDIRDLYTGYKINNLELSTGRRAQNWSEAESIWRTGQWEPRAFHDKIKAEQLGLLGLFANYSNQKNISAVVYTSPIYIPEFGPNSTIADGQFISRNPWFSTPPAEILWNEKLLPVRYSVNTPTVGEAVMRPSYGASVTGTYQDAFVRASIADKPMNQVFLALPVVVRTLDNQQYLDINVQPRFRRHRLWTLETGVKKEQGWQALASVTYDSPEQEKPFPDTWISQDLKSSLTQVYAVGYNWSKTQLAVSYLHLDGGDTADQGEQATDKSLFERRFQYQRAYRLSAQQKRIKGIGRSSDLQGSVTYDEMQRGALMSLAFVTQWDSRWSSIIQGDLLGLRDLQPSRTTDGFISSYRANDRVGVGVSYVF